jgi:general secretion pathway protein G
MRWIFGVAVLLVALACCSLDLRIDRGGQARATAARAQIENFKAALNEYRLDVGDYPSTEEGLQALRVNPGRTSWNGPYMPQDIPRDPWNVPFRYACQDGKVQITASHTR